MNSGEKKNFSISINEDQIANLSSSELESLLRSGILQGDEAETVKQIMVDKEKARRKIIVKEIHPAAIISPSPGSKKPRYRTYIKVMDPKTGKEKRKEIARTHEDDLYEWLYLYYKKGFEPKVCTHVLITLESLFGEWIEYKKIHTTAENNIERVIRTWKQYYVGADIIKMDITAIRPIDIDMWIHRVIKDNQMDKQKYLNFSLIIRQMLKYARMKEYIPANPMDGFRVDSRVLRHKKKPDPEGQVFTPSEEKAMIDLAWEDYRTNRKLQIPVASLAVIFQFQTGLRVGELCAIKYSDISGDTLHVQRMVRSQYQVVDHTKSYAGDRIVYLTPLAQEVIEESRKYYAEIGLKDPEYIFGGDSNLKPRIIDDRYREFCKRLGITHRSSHKARKTQISTLLDGDVNLDTVRRVSGHVDSRTTLNNYCFDRAEENERKKKIFAALDLT